MESYWLQDAFFLDVAEKEKDTSQFGRVDLQAAKKNTYLECQP